MEIDSMIVVIKSILVSNWLILIFSLLLSLYLIFRDAKRLNVEYIKYYDKLFKVLILGLILSRIIFFVFNFTEVSNLPWNVIPRIYIEDLYTYQIATEWSLKVLPWNFFDIYSGINVSGFFISFILIVLYKRKSYKKSKVIDYSYFASVRILILPVFIFVSTLTVLIYRKLGKGFFLESLSDMDYIVFFLIVIVALWTGWFARKEKVQFDKDIRNAIRETADEDKLVEVAKKVKFERFMQRKLNNSTANDSTVEAAVSQRKRNNLLERHLFTSLYTKAGDLKFLRSNKKEVNDKKSSFQ